ncbi:hypothetical protein QJQ45_018904 [Haematococcus lacustris]|nr:hypothetical protein QJQ45_018904 [Haematococcus lacustris]
MFHLLLGGPACGPRTALRAAKHTTATLYLALNSLFHTSVNAVVATEWRRCRALEMDVKLGLPKAGGISFQLWQEAEPIALESLHSPFVTALAHGTLPRSAAFQHYVAQDAAYLQYFARAYALALAKCDPHVIGEDSYTQLGQLLRGVHSELRLHADYAASWGVRLGHAEASPATRAYTDFLMEVAEAPENGLAEVLAAMAPCARLYAFLGCQLAAAFPAAEHAYSSWINTYANPDYLALPDIKEAMLDKVAAAGQGDPGRGGGGGKGGGGGGGGGAGGKDPVDPARLQRLYTRAMQLEVDFFCAHPATPPARPVTLLVVDFDETCTQADTCACLLAAAAAAQQRAAPSVEAGLALRARLDEQARAAGSRLQHAAEAAARPAAAHIVAAEAVNGGSTPGDGERYNPAGVAAFVERLSDFDIAMNAVLERAGVLAGLRAQATGLACHVLSVSWSSEFAAAALAVPLSLPSATDIEHLLEELSSRAQAGPAEAPQAGYGIVLGSNALLRRVAEAYGVRLLPLVCAPLTGPGEPGTLYMASGWPEIEAFVFGPRSYERHPYREQMQAARRAWPAHQDMASATETTGKSDSCVVEPTSAHRAATTVVPPRVLTIAGSDSGGGAGIQADLKTLLACGVFGTSAVTALTVQNTTGVSGVHVPPVCFLAQQIDAVLGDIGADAVKTGMLPDKNAVQVVADKVRQHAVRQLVVDPVMISTSGHSLADSEVAASLLSHLIPLATLVTPNIPEASALLGGRPITSVSDMGEAAQQLQQRTGCGAVLIKGGHLGPGADQDPQPQGQFRSVGLRLGQGPQHPFNHGWAVDDWHAGHVRASTGPSRQGAGRQPRGARWPQADVARAVRLYAVTDPGLNQRAGRTLAEAVAAAVQGGATIVQVCRAAGVPLVVNDRVDIALALGPDVGVHVGQSDLPCSVVRQLLGPSRLLGVSVKTVSEAELAVQQGADYLGCGAVCPTSTKDSDVIGIQGLRQVCEAVKGTPVVAIGGVGAANASVMVQAGAAGIAVVSAVFGQSDPAAAALVLRDAVDRALATHNHAT